VYTRKKEIGSLQLCSSVTSVGFKAYLNFKSVDTSNEFLATPGPWPCPGTGLISGQILFGSFVVTDGFSSLFIIP
jgi:hypothetical protein